MEKEKLISVSIAAQKLDVSESAVRRMIKDPVSPLVGYKISRGSVRVSVESLELCKKIITKDSIRQ